MEPFYVHEIEGSIFLKMAIFLKLTYAFNTILVNFPESHSEKKLKANPCVLYKMRRMQESYISLKKKEKNIFDFKTYYGNLQIYLLA